jgi:hypothetical protein
LLAAAGLLILGASAAGLAVYNRTPEKGPVASVDSRARLRFLIPAYIYPTGEGLKQWERILESSSAAPTVAIVNTDSGPGKIADPNYAKIVERARQRGVTTLGYVSTRYAARPLQEVKSDVDRWVQFYPGIDGIFFDEQASSADQVLYYVALYDYARNQKGLSLVITNPGTVCAEDYLARDAADVVCLIDVTKEFSAYQRPAWTDRYPAERFAAMLCEISTPAEMEKFVSTMRGQRLGYCYVTDEKEPNPWGRLPSYWGAEVEAVRQVNQHP